MSLFNRYLTIVLVAVALFYLFRDPNGTNTIISSLSNFNARTIGALQGRSF